jgi:hypothetical protein
VASVSLACLISLIADRIYSLGYKQRDKISKALKTRAQAIITALERYNRAAQCLTPPPDSLSWHDIVQMATLADFDLLQLSHTDIRTLPWTQPVARQAMSLHFGIKRAHEEILRLNVEIRRVITYMVNESAHWASVIAAVQDLDPVLSTYLSRKADYHDRIFREIGYYLLKASKLPGFSGTLEEGTPLDRPLPTITTPGSNLRWLSALDSNPEVLNNVEVKEELVDTAADMENDLMIDLVEKFGNLE